MSKFKVGDKVQFYNPFNSAHTGNPILNSVNKIIYIRETDQGEYLYYFKPKGSKDPKWALESEIKLVNSLLIKERLGIK